MGIRLAEPDALSDPPFLHRTATGVTIDLRARPGARRTALELADGELKAFVTAPPEDGKANGAVIALLANEWRLPKSAFEIVKGGTARAKTVSVSADPALVTGRIADWMCGRG